MKGRFGLSRVRRTLRRHRTVVLVTLAASTFYGIQGDHFAQAYAYQVAESRRVAEMAARLGLPVERLEARHPGVLEALRRLFADADEAAREAQLTRLSAHLAKVEADVAANPFAADVAAVKASYELARLEGVLDDLLQVGSPAVLDLSPAARRALLRNLAAAVAEDVKLAAPAGMPASARGRQQQMRGRLASLFARLRPILTAPDALSDQRIAHTVAALNAALDPDVRPRRRPLRAAEAPLPVQVAEKTAPVEEAGSAALSAGESSAIAAAPATTAKGSAPGAAVAASRATSPSVAALVASLGRSPARIFAWVHDQVRYDPKWGQVRSPEGVVLEREGTSWDQAALLQQMLAEAGVEAVLEWGEVQLPIAALTEITGVSSPFRAGDMLATGGVPIALLTSGGQVVSARMSHVWVKAHLDYVPDRGVRHLAGDTWLRLDPTLKRTTQSAGIPVGESVRFALADYLRSGSALSPRRAYEESLWAYIRANDIPCTTLDQLEKAVSVRESRFPYVPGTLRGALLSVAGEAAAVPPAFAMTVMVEVDTAGGDSLLSWTSPAAALYGKRVEVRYAGATAEDQATIAAYGGILATPPYLVQLRPTLRLGSAQVASGNAVGSALPVTVTLTLREASGFTRVLPHDTLAGEQHVLALDLGQLPAAVVSEHQQALLAARSAGQTEEAAAEELYLVGAQYLHQLGKDLGELSGWTWHRLVRLGTAGLTSRTGVVTTSVAGAPLALTEGPRYLDLSAMTLGLFHADGRTDLKRSTFELLGAQSSFGEGEVFATVLERHGISAVAALTLAQREGQALLEVTAANVDAALAQADLGAAVEDDVRHAVSQGKLAWIAEEPVSAHRWRGTGYVLADPTTGAAAYLISGGFAGGSETGEPLEALQDLLGSEPWLESTPMGELVAFLLGAVDGGNGGGGGDPGTNQSDPINLSTGNFWLTETDLAIQARGIPVVFSRTYNSRSTRPGPLGFGWSFSFGERLDEQADSSVVYREEDGTEHPFASDGAGGYVAPPGKHLTLTREASGFRLRTSGGLVSTFALDGRLLTVSEPNGNTVGLGYDADGNLAGVTDAAGRQALVVETAGGKITRLTDLAGRNVIFTYTGEDLTGVRDSAGKDWSYVYDADHNLIARSNPLGETDGYAYDAHDRCYRHVDPLGNVEVFSYVHRGRRAVLTDQRGYDNYFELDERGRATLQVDPLGNASRSTWSAGNDRLTTTDPRGGTTTRTFDAQGNVQSITNAKQETTRYTYEPVFNRVATTTDPAGHVVTNGYDARGNLTATTQTVGGQTVEQTYAYDSFGLLASQTAPNGGSTTFAWDATTGALVSQTDALQHATTMETDALGRVTAIVDPLQNRVEIDWDAKDRLAGARDPFGNATAVRYDDAGRQLEVTTPRGTTRSQYDAAGRAVAITDPLGNTRRSEYDAAGNTVVTIDARGNRTATSYDPAGRVAAVVDALGGVWSFGYCAEIGGGGAGGEGADASFCELTDPLGNVTRQDFDALGRVTRITDPLGHLTQVGYDARGRKTSHVDPLGRTTRHEYDDLGRLDAIVEANQARTEYTYDAGGNLVATRDAAGRVWPRTYDAIGRLASESDPLGHTTTYRYDALGNLAAKVKPDGREIGYAYDVRRLRKVLLPGGGEEAFAYDGRGRRTAMANAEVSLGYVFDALDRLTQSTDVTLGKSVGYQYDAAGNLVRLTTPEATVDYVYDGANRLVQQRDGNTGTFRYEYDAAGRRSRLRYPNGVAAEYAYDAASRLLSILTRNGHGQVIDGYSYTYDDAGNRTGMRSLRDGLVHDYQYDAVDRLTGWERRPEGGAVNRFERYAYDAVGNRETLTDELGVVTYGYDTANRLLQEVRQPTGGAATTTSHSWDDNGNLTATTVGGAAPTTYTWDALDRLASVAGPAGIHGYGYDPTGIRCRETSGGDVRRFLLALDPQGFGDLVAVYGAGGDPQAYFSHGVGADEPLAQVRASGTSYFHGDALGSVTALSASSGQLSGARSYSPFGGVESASGTDGRFAFTGREFDASGLMYYRARYYQPSVGRFTAADTWQGDLASPATQHRYSYTGNAPTRWIDPSGHVRAELVKAYMAAMLTYTLGMAICTFFLESDDYALLFGMQTVQNFLIVGMILFILDEYAHVVIRGIRVGVAAMMATVQELIRGRGIVYNPVAKVLLIVVYLLVRVAVTAGKMMTSGVGWAVTLRNIGDFWKSGNVADLAKGPQG